MPVRVPVFLFVAILCAEAAGVLGGEPIITPLVANTPLERERAFLNGTARQYILKGLQAHTSYEVRVSYPATTPASIELRIAGSVKPARRLLDTEKLVFHTDSNGRVWGASHGQGQGASESREETSVQLRAYGRFVHRDGPGAGPTELVYNIVCEELLLRVLPQSILPLVLVCALIAWAAWAAGPIVSDAVVPRLLRWVLQS